MVKHILLCLTVAMLSAPLQAGPNTGQQHIEVTPGESSQQLTQRYPDIMQTKHVHGLNLCFTDVAHDKNFPLTIKHGRHSIHLPYAIKLIGFDDTYHNADIDGINVMFNLTATGGAMMHGAAKRALFTMFRQLLADGWQVTFLPHDPRLRGRDTLVNNLPETSKSLSMDATYEPTLAEWMKIKEIPRWRFYANNIYVYFYFHRDREKMDPNQPGDYTFNMEVITGEAYHRHNFDSEKREQWRKHWVELALNMRKCREMAEADARRLGLHIDTSYQDPPLPLLPPMRNPVLPPHELINNG